MNKLPLRQNAGKFRSAISKIQKFHFQTSVSVKAVVVWIVCATLFAATSVIGYRYALELVDQASIRLQRADVAVENQRLADIAKAAAEAELARKKAEEEAMALGGYTPAGNGLYYRWANKSEFHCGYWDCAAVVVATAESTCSGVYVEANITSGGVAIGLANDTVGALGKWDVAAMILEDYVGGDGFELTKVNCW